MTWMSGRCWPQLYTNGSSHPTLHRMLTRYLTFLSICSVEDGTHMLSALSLRRFTFFTFFSICSVEDGTHMLSALSLSVQLKMVPTCFLPCLSDVLLFSVHATPAEFLYLCLVVDTLTKYFKEQPQGCGLGYGLIMFIGCCQAVKRKTKKKSG